MLRVLDLFSGLEGWSGPAKARGHEVVTLDFDPRFGADHTVDILTISDLAELQLDPGKPFDVIFASPPCESFSTGSIGRHWGGGSRAYEPKTEQAKMALRIMNHTFDLIDDYVREHPRTRFVIENPRGVMRKLAPRPPSDTTWYCQWGERRAKPTDLWTNIRLYADGYWPKCHNGGTDHDAQSRYYWKRKALGQTGGTQGLKDAATRAIIPVRLAEAMTNYVEGFNSPVNPMCACRNQLQPHERMVVCDG